MSKAWGERVSTDPWVKLGPWDTCFGPSLQALACSVFAETCDGQLGAWKATPLSSERVASHRYIAYFIRRYCSPMRCLRKCSAIHYAWLHAAQVPLCRERFGTRTATGRKKQAPSQRYACPAPSMAIAPRARDRWEASFRLIRTGVIMGGEAEARVDGEEGVDGVCL